MIDPTVILAGLRATPKTLPSALLYDALGSALFEAITELPEYGLTRADLRMIEAHAADVARALDGPLEVVELGPGAGRKAALFLPAVTARQPHTVCVALGAKCSRRSEPSGKYALPSTVTMSSDSARTAPFHSARLRVIGVSFGGCREGSPRDEERVREGPRGVGPLFEAREA